MVKSKIFRASIELEIEVPDYYNAEYVKNAIIKENEDVIVISIERIDKKGNELFEYLNE